MSRISIFAVALSATMAIAMAGFTVWPRSDVGALLAVPDDAVVAAQLAVLDDELPQIPHSAPDPIRSVRLLFFGDVMLGRYVESLMDQYGDDYPFEKIQPLIDQYDFVHVNLEGPIEYEHRLTPTSSVNFGFKSTTGELLARHGIDAVGLGNNHTLDRGRETFADTLLILDAAGVLHSGHSTAMGLEPVLRTDAPGLPLTFVSFNFTFPFNDQDAAIETIKSLAAEFNTPIIVNAHWGQEYQTRHNAAQEALAHRLIDAGADLIIGHHPHVVQDVEVYNGVKIFYSLGNFIFDQYFSEETQRGLAVGIEILEGQWSFTTYDLLSVKSQPMIISAD